MDASYKIRSRDVAFSCSISIDYDVFQRAVKWNEQKNRIFLAVFILLFHLSPSVHDKEDNSLRSEVILLAANSWVHHKERDKYTEVLIQQKPMALV